MISLVIYVAIFSLITVLVSMIFTNMNRALFLNRGSAINYTTLNKLQYNITESALESNDITVSDNKISYSNGDIYEYDSDSKTILLNGGVLCTAVDSFSANLVVANNIKQLNLDVTFNKYLNTLSKNIVSNVEVY